MFNEQFTRLLSLSKNEIKVLKILKKESGLNVASLHNKTNVPRMTVYLALSSLKKRGPIEYNRIGKRKYWKIVDKETTSTTLFGKSDFSIIENLENLWGIWSEAINTHKGSRIYGIQPTESLKEILSKSSLEERITPINKLITKNKLIIEGLIKEDYIPTYLKYFKGDKNKQRKVLQDLQDRSADMVYIDNRYFNNPVDFMMFNNKAFLINWRTETALEIRNMDMLLFLKELFDMARGYGKKVDQGGYIREQLKNL